MLNILMSIYGFVQSKPKLKDYSSTVLGACVGFYMGTLYVGNENKLEVLEKTISYYEAIQATTSHYNELNNEQYGVATQLLKDKQQESERIRQVNVNLSQIVKNFKCDYIDPEFMELFKQLYRPPVGTTEGPSTPSSSGATN